MIIKPPRLEKFLQLRTTLCPEKLQNGARSVSYGTAACEAQIPSCMIRYNDVKQLDCNTRAVLVFSSAQYLMLNIAALHVSIISRVARLCFDCIAGVCRLIYDRHLSAHFAAPNIDSMP